MAVNISNILSSEGHEVLLVVSRNGGELSRYISPRVHLEYLDKKSFADFFAFIRFFKLVNRFKPNYLHAHSTSVYWAFLVKLVSQNRFKLIFHDHYGLAEGIRDNDRTILRLISFCFDKVIVVNDILYEWCFKNLKVKPNAIRNIANFPYLNIFPSAIDKSRIQIVSLANFRPQKDHHTLLKAFTLVKLKYPNLSIKLVMAGKSFSDTYFDSINDYIKQQNLQNSVEVLTSNVQVEQLLAESSIGVLSSESEGLPVSLLEYGLASLPVVVTNVGQCASVVHDGEHGRVVSSKNPLALAEALEKMLLNMEDSRTMGKQFQEHVLENYGHGQFLRQYIKFIQQNG